MIQRVSNVSFKKWKELREAIEELHKPPESTYTKLVSDHKRKYRMHGSMQPNPALRDVEYKRFLPWHRAYLIEFEQAIRAIDSALSLPYWDWDADQGALKGFDDLVGEAERGDLNSPWFTCHGEASGLADIDDYLEFSKELELLHNRGHGWIDGTMNTMESPKDPAFWFHHAQVDRIWSLWQQKHRGQLATGLSEADKRLDPWGDKYTVESVNDLSKLGYEYI